ncbi:MAG: peptide transporter substrate-binding protein, partial [Haloplasmataceae bacterium]|nr:peptide transporter substrate-binding protein [Haloplasmataceae bacterium]
MKKLSLLFIAVVVALTLSACKKTTTGSGEESANSQNYFGSYAGHYETLNYLYTQSASDSDLYSNFVDGLVENDNYGNIVPSLATGWDYEMRDGKQVWTFDIRQGVKWVESDGTEYAEVEAQDWISAAEYILNPSTQSDLTFLMFVFIDGAEAYYTAKEDIANAKADIKAADLILNDTTKTAEEKAAAQVTKTSAQEVLDETVEKPFSSVGVKAVEKYKLEYTLAKPAPYFLTALTYSVFFPVNKAWLQDQGTNFGYDGESILYNGAYTLTE